MLPVLEDASSPFRCPYLLSEDHFDLANYPVEAKIYKTPHFGDTLVHDRLPSHVIVMMRADPWRALMNEAVSGYILVSSMTQDPRGER